MRNRLLRASKTETCPVLARLFSGGSQVVFECVGFREMTKNLAALAIFPFALAYSGITAPLRGIYEYNHFFLAYHV